MKKIKTLVLFVIPYTIYFILNTGVASAEGASIRVSPSLLKLKVLAPVEVNAPLSVENLLDSSVTLTVIMLPFKAGGEEDGEIEYIDSISPLLGKTQSSLDNSSIQLVENGLPVAEIVLGPKQKKDLRLKMSIPESQKTSLERYFSVLFISKPDVFQANSPLPNSRTILRTGVAMNTLLSINPRKEASGTIEEFKTDSFAQKGPINFNIKIHNNTSNYISPKGKITIKNFFGQTVDVIDIKTFNILADSSRKLVNSDGKSTVVSQRKFLLGYYSAELELNLSEHGEKLNKTIYFAVLPVKELVASVIILAIAVATLKRVRKKMSE